MRRSLEMIICYAEQQRLIPRGWCKSCSTILREGSAGSDARMTGRGLRLAVRAARHRKMIIPL
jgi:hypothetical protein